MKTDDLLSKLFSNNPDTYARPSNHVPATPAPMPDPALVRGRHLEGIKRAGAYCPTQDGYTIFGAIDIDGESHKEAYDGDVEDALGAIIDLLPEKDYICVESKSGTGYHVWFVFEEMQDATNVRKFLATLIHEAGLWGNEAKPVTGIEIFPKSNRAPKLGNFLWLPFFGEGMNSEFDFEFLSEIPDYDHEPPEDWEQFVFKRKVRDVSDGPVREEHEEGEWRDINVGDIPDLDRAATLLGELDPDIGYEDWFRILAVFQTCYGEEAYDVVKNWSWMGSKWDENQFESSWASFAGGSELNFGTFVYILRENGYGGRISERANGGEWDTGKRAERKKVWAEWKPNLLTFDEVMELETTSDQEIAEHLLERLYGHEDETPVIVAEGMLWQYDPLRGTYIPLDQEWVEARISDYDGEYTRVIIDPQGNQTKPKRVRVSKFSRASIYDSMIITGQDWAGKINEWPVGVGFRNGFLSADGMIDHSPGNLCRHWVDCEFEDDAYYQEWEDFLVRSVETPEEIEALQIFSGAVFMGDAPRHERALLLHGPGGSGKSTFLETMKELVPEEYRVHIAPQDLDNDDYVIADMAGKKLNLVTDIDVRGFDETSKFKRAVEGTAMRARQPGQRSFTLKPQAAHVFATNKLPETTDTTEGFFRRWLLIGFPDVVALKDRDDAYKPEMVRKAREESWLYAWAWKGWQKLQENGGLLIPDAHTQNVATWKEGTSSFHKWYAEMVEPMSSDGDWRKATDLHKDYVVWSQRNDYPSWRIVSNAVNFGTLLTETQCDKKRRKDGMYYQVRLKKKRGF